MYRHHQPVKPYKPGPIVKSTNLADRIKAFDQFAKDRGHTPFNKTQSVLSLPQPSTQSGAQVFDSLRLEDGDNTQYKSELNLRIGTTRKESTHFPSNALQTSNAHNRNGCPKPRNAGVYGIAPSVQAETYNMVRNKPWSSDRNIPSYEPRQRSLQNIAYVLTGSTEGLQPNTCHRGRNRGDDQTNNAPVIDPQSNTVPSKHHSEQNNVLEKKKKSTQLNFSTSFHGSSKELAERRKTFSPQLSLPSDNLPSPQDTTEPTNYSPTYTKSPTRKPRPKSMSVFPPVLEQTECQLVPKENSNNEISGKENKDIGKPNILENRERSKSDTHMDRRYYEIDERKFQAVHSIKDSQVVFGNVHHNSTGALSGVSGNSSSQFAERKHILDSTQETLDDFKLDVSACSDGSSSVELRRYRNAKLILEKTGLLIIKCAEEEGSTYLGYRLLTDYENTTRYILGDVSEYVTCITGGEESYTVLVDDAFRGSQFDGQMVNKWQTQIDRSASRRKKGSLKIVFVLKYKNAQNCRDLLTRYDECVIDFSDESNQLNKEEKMVILKECIKRRNEQRSQPKIDISQDTLESIAEKAISFGYLGMVKLFLATISNIEQGVHFFLKPSVGFYKEIHGWRESEEEAERNKYLALAAIFLFNGRISTDAIAVLSRETYFDIIQAKRNAKSSVDLLNCSKSSKRKNKYAVQPKVQMESYKLLVDLASIIECDTNFGKRIKDGVDCLKDVFLRANCNEYTFMYPSIEVAVSLSIGNVFPEAAIRLFSRTSFHAYVGTDMSFPNAEDRCIRLELANKDLCMMAFERLRKELKDGNCAYFVSHPLMRDARFWHIASENCDGQQLYERFMGMFWSRKTFVDILLGTRDQTTDTSLLVLSLEYPFYEQSSTQDCRTLADWAIKHKKWENTRKDDNTLASAIEKATIERCCEEDWEDVYMSLVDIVNINKLPNTYVCLIEAIKSASLNILKDLLSVVKFSEEHYKKALAEGIACYTRERVPERRVILEELAQYSDKDSLLESICRAGDRRSLAVALTVFDMDINTIFTVNGPVTFALITYNHWRLFQVISDQFGADPRVTYRGQMSIHLAARLGSLNILRYLCNHDNNLVYENDTQGMTPLHISADKGHVSCVIFLLGTGAFVNETDKSGQTALHKAAGSGHLQTVHILISKGADIYIKDVHRDTAVGIARRQKHEHIVRKMLGGSKIENSPWENLDLRNLFNA